MAKQVRIKDIAIKAGVSTGTVDRVLHKRGEVKSETKELILKIAKDLEYKPNVAARLLKASTDYRIAVLLPKPVNQKSFWTKHPAGIYNAIENGAPYSIKPDFYAFSLHDEADFVERTKELIASQPHGVIMAPLHRNESVGFCKQLDELKIPYVFIDTNIEEANCLSFIGEDAIKSGRIAASLVDSITPIDKDILIVNIAKSLVNTQHLNSRNQGFMSYFVELSKNQGLKINLDLPDDNTELVEERLDALFENNKNIGAILVSSSRTFVIANYLKKQNKSLCLVGYESIDDNLQLMQDGIIDFLVSQRPIEQTEKALSILINCLVNKIIPHKSELQSVDIVNREAI